jgi:hypothetical protein
VKLIPLLFALWSLFVLDGSHAARISELAAKVIEALGPEQRQRAVFTFEEANRYEFHYVPASMMVRNGISLTELDSAQKSRVYALMEACLSPDGYDKSRRIMAYEPLLQLLQPNNPHRIPDNYFLALYGRPGLDSLWGWKISGHHLALNYTFSGEKIAFSPFFFGIYPAEVPSGPHRGERLLNAEEDLGLALLHSLDSSQQKAASIALRAFTDIVTTNAQETSALPPAGLERRALTLAQQMQLDELIALYLSAMPHDLAAQRLARLQSSDLNQIRFAWAGAPTREQPHYYRIQGPSFLIEFDNTQNNANHIHTVWRDFNGDFGRDLLREHDQQHK